MYRPVILGALTEFGPLSVFFILGTVYGFMPAVAGLLVSTLLVITFSRLALGKLPYFALMSGGFVVIESTLTLGLQEPLFLIITDAVFYWFIALVFLVSWLRHRSVLEFFFGHIFALTDTGWRLLTRRWALCFLFFGICNVVAALLLTPEEWINYRIARSVLIASFGMWQFRLASRHRLPSVSDRWGLRLNKKPQ